MQARRISVVERSVSGRGGAYYMYEEQHLFTDWRKSAELQPVASQRRAAAGQRGNAAAPGKMSFKMGGW